MNRKHWLVRWVALILALSLLTLPGCKKSAPTTEPTTATAVTVAPTTTEETPTDPTVTKSPDESATPTEATDATQSTKPSATKKPAVSRPAATKKPVATKIEKPSETKATTATKPAETKATAATKPAATTKPTTAAPKQGVKNVIFMIADGGGYDNFTLANKVKQTMQVQGINKLTGAKTQITGNLLSALGKSNVNGLYLNELLVGSANTLLNVNHGAESNYKSYITDSAAAGTALATGYKSQYTFLGLDEKKRPKASITELARMNGMATGLVTTKSYMDATPQAFFTSHSIYRYEYQDNSFQSLLSGIDVVIGEGTEFGDLYKTYPTSHPNLSASKLGYILARNKTQLMAKANDSATKKLWAPILGAGKTTENDRAADRLTYDVDAAESAEQSSLLDMTQAALKVLGNNINDPDGFFLMIEGGALDNAAEDGCLRAAVGEYLAFDEAFGYCVKWAESRGDTIVIAVPDHDSGGFSGIEACEKALINSIITGKIGNTDLTEANYLAHKNQLSSDKQGSFNHFKFYQELLTKAGEDTSKMALQKDHTDMAVPISLYAPDSVRNSLLTAMGLPTAAGQIRTGTNEYYAKNESGSMTWYKSSALNNDYTIDNTKIAPALAKVLKLGSLDSATASLFVAVGKYNNKTFSGNYGGELIFADTTHSNSLAAYNCNTYKNGGLSISRNATTYTLNGVTKDIPKIGNAIPKALFILDSSEQATKGTFYVPYAVLKDAGLK